MIALNRECNKCTRRQLWGFMSPYLFCMGKCILVHFDFCSADFVGDKCFNWSFRAFIISLSHVLLQKTNLMLIHLIMITAGNHKNAKPQNRREKN